MQVKASLLSDSNKSIVGSDEFARDVPDSLMAVFKLLSLLGSRSVKLSRCNSDVPSVRIRCHHGVESFYFDKPLPCFIKGSTSTLDRLGSELVLDVREFVDKHSDRVHQVSWPRQNEILIFDAPNCLAR